MPFSLSSFSAVQTPVAPVAFPDLNTIGMMLRRFTISSHVTKATIASMLDLCFVFFVLQDLLIIITHKLHKSI